MRKLIFMFDLEATIVDSWNSACPLYKKIGFINSFINNFMASNDGIHEEPIFGVFSFACDTQDEKQIARNLASHTGRKITDDDSLVPCWGDLEELVRFRVDLQKWEIVNLFGKDKMFDLWSRQFPDCDFILFDDCLPDKDSTTIRDGQMIRKIRV